MLTPKKLALAHTLGPVVVDIAGTVLTEHEIRRLEHPMTGAVILFTRNFTSVEMLRALCGAIHAVRPGILITVDHEGGRVQRFREGFTEVPSLPAVRPVIRLRHVWRPQATCSRVNFALRGST